MKHKDVPVVGKIYHVFDDGKITWSRHYPVRCTEVIPFDRLSSDPKHASLFDAWKHRGCDWLYAEDTDFVVACEDIEDAASERVLREDIWDRTLYYTRTKDGGWFGFGTMLDDGVLDVDRSIWSNFLDAVREGETYEYSPEEVAEIEAADSY